jgi:hypothetical protein
MVPFLAPHGFRPLTAATGEVRSGLAGVAGGLDLVLRTAHEAGESPVSNRRPEKNSGAFIQPSSTTTTAAAPPLPLPLPPGSTFKQPRQRRSQVAALPSLVPNSLSIHPFSEQAIGNRRNATCASLHLPIDHPSIARDATVAVRR